MAHKHSLVNYNCFVSLQVPYSSPLDGHLLMHVNCSFEGGITERGFLTMFEDVGGYGAWNRRWCVLSGMHLRYWRYPDDETRKVSDVIFFITSWASGTILFISFPVFEWNPFSYYQRCWLVDWHNPVKLIVDNIELSILLSCLIRRHWFYFENRHNSTVYHPL